MALSEMQAKLASVDFKLRAFINDNIETLRKIDEYLQKEDLSEGKRRELEGVKETLEEQIQKARFSGILNE